MRLVLDGGALVANWRALDRLSGSASAGAAVKADGYGLGAAEVVRRLSVAGCRDFFVAHWGEAQALAGRVDPARLAVLHGIAPGEQAAARVGFAVPVLNSAEQIARWREAGGGRCHVMIDTGMSRLGLDWRENIAGLCAGLDVDLCMSHLASADEDSAQNAAQLQRFETVRQSVQAARYSFANSAGIALGRDYHFDCTRPGLALYGGVPCDALAEPIRPVMRLETRILQVRNVRAGDSIGYGATFVAEHDMRIATLALGYADGFKRALSSIGAFRHGDARLPILGRVSMDLTCIDLAAAPNLGEGDWIAADLVLPEVQAVTGISQYEWLTQIGRRFDRIWVD
ncbi:MAG: alanine racemase [Sphingomonadales bacterium RIFCSPHIGHO2_01_FULL_65_20]|jgi:alanine racemase|uniref:alanine racemase n=1 Tax=unclassified Blastomonas TaxID=2626550 RepID=UPI000836E05A|nr:alanine racemase [Blastomonas sp.]OHC97686.1 MAG: alanine racemase [Sphingomonadales bacterium RIFCSPHIGHO2_01_FULL_65_20]